MTVFPKPILEKTSFLNFEMALNQAEINYCSIDQLISFDFNIPTPNFILPVYKIFIYVANENDIEVIQSKVQIELANCKINQNGKTPKEVNVNVINDSLNNWKIFYFQPKEVAKDVNFCVLSIVNYIKKNHTKKHTKFTFVDLFSGVGGFRIPLEKLGGKCLGFSEIDKDAIDTYKSNFFDKINCDEVELGSITKLNILPFENIDLIVGGVPCQSWSVAGKMRGFDDPRGKLWLDTIRVVELNKPKVFVFENVKGLMDPRNKANLELIVESFKSIGYDVSYQLLNSYDFGLPQNRDRIFIVGFRKDLNIEKRFDFPTPLSKKSSLYDILDDIEFKQNNKIQLDPNELFGGKIPMARNRFQKIDELNDFFIFCDTRNGHSTIHSWDIINTTKRQKEICMHFLKNRRKKKYGNSDGNPLKYSDLLELMPDLKETELVKLINLRILRYQNDKGYEFVNSKNSAGINGIYRIYLPSSNIFSTLTATGTKDVIALKNIEGKNPKEYKSNFIYEIIQKKQYRSITSKEAGKLQGFPSSFVINRKENIAKKQFGNAVSTHVIYNLAKKIIQTKILKDG